MKNCFDFSSCCNDKISKSGFTVRKTGATAEPLSLLIRKLPDKKLLNHLSGSAVGRLNAQHLCYGWSNIGDFNFPDT
jgi:hypothetical protein